MIILEWFGMAQFSRNWGTTAISPVLGGNLFSLAFGRNLDRHASGPATLMSAKQLGIGVRGGLPDAAEHMCFEGLECYKSSLKMTIVASFAGLVLSIWATWRDKRVYAVRERQLATRTSSVASFAGSDNSEASGPLLPEEERLLLSSS